MARYITFDMFGNLREFLCSMFWGFFQLEDQAKASATAEGGFPLWPSVSLRKLFHKTDFSPVMP